MEYKDCAYCGTEVTENDEKYICPKCGKVYHQECWEIEGQCSCETEVASGQEAQPVSESIAEAEESQNNICAFCDTEIAEDDAVYVCPDCEKHYHQECWEIEEKCDCKKAEIEPVATPEKALEVEPEKKAPGEAVGKLCPFCKTEIKETDEVIICPACELPHHADCWAENKGCATFGCEYQNSVEKEEKKNTCMFCGADLNEGDVFCTKCGRRQETPAAQLSAPSVTATVAPTAKPAVQSSNPAAFTPRADDITDSSKPKKKKSPAVIIVIVIIAAIAGYFGYNQYQQKLINEYIADCNSFSSAVTSTGADMETIGKAIATEWYTYIFDNKEYYGYSYYSYYEKYDSIEDAVSTAQSQQISKISSVKSERSNIDSLYSRITSNSIAYSKMSSVTSKVEDVYDDYKKMYDCVMDPEGNYNEFKTNYNSCDTNLADSIEDLNNATKGY